MVGIPTSPRRTTTKKIHKCNYNENDKEDKDKWEVDYDGGVGPFFDATAYDKEFDDDRENPVSRVGEGNIGVKYQAG